MITRDLSSWLHKQIDKAQVCHVYGMRQTGKTTLMSTMKDRLPNSHLYSLQDLVTLRRYSADPENWVLEIEDIITCSASGKSHIFIDEVQKIPDFFQAIQGIYDQYKGKVKFWIWGSSARALKRKNAETLAGRVLSRTLWPLAQTEIFETSSIVSELENVKTTSIHRPMPRGYLKVLCEEMLCKSLLPEPFLQTDKMLAYELLEGYSATYLENEIRRENFVKDLGTFEKFLKLSAAFNTGVVNYSAIANYLDVSYHTVQSFYTILIDTFVTKAVPAYSSSMQVQLVKSPKMYFTDTGLARFISGMRHVPTPSTQEFGKTFEGFIINEIQKQIEYQSLPWDVAYLRTKEGREIDLIITTPKTTLAIEVKAKAKISRRDTENLRYFMERDHTLSHGIVVSLMPSVKEVEKRIFNIPAWVL